MILTIGFFYLNNKKEVSVISVNQNFYQDKIETQPEISIDKVENIKKEIQIAAKPLSEKNIKVSLIVSDKKYEIETKDSSSVFEAMKNIEEKSKSDNLFSFKYKEYSSLGNFITEINGSKGSPGKYWIYYVNNEKASVGASKYILKEGDIISWKQEGM